MFLLVHAHYQEQHFMNWSGAKDIIVNIIKNNPLVQLLNKNNYFVYKKKVNIIKPVIAIP